MRSVSKSFGDNEVIHSVDLQVEDNEFMVFVGPSGCGKSTLLRLIAGLEDVNQGEISIGGRTGRASAACQTRDCNGFSVLRSLSPHDCF